MGDASHEESTGPPSLHSPVIGPGALREADRPEIEAQLREGARERVPMAHLSLTEGRSHLLANLSDELNGVKIAREKVYSLPNNRAGPLGSPGQRTGML